MLLLILRTNCVYVTSKLEFQINPAVSVNLTVYKKYILLKKIPAFPLIFLSKVYVFPTVPAQNEKTGLSQLFQAREAAL